MSNKDYRRTQRVSQLEETLSHEFLNNIEILNQTPGVDQKHIEDFKRTEILRRSICHVKAYAAERYPRKYTAVKSKVKGNMTSQTLAKKRKVVPTDDFNFSVSQQRHGSPMKANQSFYGYHS